MSEDVTAEKRGPGRPRKATIEMTSRRSAALARRLAPGGAIFGGGTLEIPLKDRGRKLKWFNSDIHESRHYEAVHKLGWTPVRPEDLAAGTEELGLHVNAAGDIVRGVRGNELLCWVPDEDYVAIQAKKTEANNREIGRPDRIKESVANAVASVSGDEGGQFVKDHFVGTVTDMRGSVPV